MDDPASLARLRHAERYRFPRHDTAPDLMPPADVDFRPYVETLISSDPRPKVSLPRQDMANQVRNLRRGFTGKPELLLLHGVVISYLRRDTPHTAKARGLFHRLWTEQQALLLDRLNPRWLVSTLQTFHDHGATEAQKKIGGMGFLYGNLIKVYESERSLQGPDRVPSGPLSNAGFPGLFGFTPGDDILRNINVLTMAAADSDPVAGPVLLELMSRTRRSRTLFARIDALKQAEPYAARQRFYTSFND